MRELWRKLAALLSAGALLSTMAVSAAPGEPLKDKTGGGEKPDEGYVAETRYWGELDRYAQEGIPAYRGEDVVLFPERADEPRELKEYQGENAFLWEDGDSQISWTVEVPASALYAIRVEYCAMTGSGATIERSVLIDGEVPFYEAYNIPFSRLYVDDGEPAVNSLGDEVKPAQKEVARWQTVMLHDKQGLYSAPLQFYLEAGKRTLTLRTVNGAMAIKSVTLTAPSTLKSYAEVSAEYEAKGYRPATQSARMEAEDCILLKNNSASGLYSDGDPMVIPRSLGKSVMNAVSLGDAGNNFISFQLTVPEDGLYQLVLRDKQCWGDGLSMYREISIDGEVPFQEFAQYKFDYDRSWRSEALADGEGNPYLVYLEKGTCELRLTSRMGEEYNTRILRLLTECSAELSGMVLKIRMITGSNPDINYDYELGDKIPELGDAFDSVIAKLQECRDIVRRIGEGKDPTLYEQMKLIQVQLGEMRDDPFVIAKRMDELTDSLTNFGNWISGLTSQPLSIDYIELTPPGQAVKNYRSNFFQVAQTVLVNFFTSFVKDYNTVGTLSGAGGAGTTLEVWIGRGKDWAETLKQLSDNSFTPASGIDIHVNVLPTGQLNTGAVNSLMLAIAGGAAPDVCLGVSSSSPGEFAIRNAVTDLRRFEDFDEAASRFYAESLVPFSYRGGTYALPETVNFKALFYRKDIVANLGISIPETWDDLLNKVLPVLNQNSMQFYLQSVSSILSVAGMFEVFLYQNGGTYYNEEYTESALDSPEAFQAFQSFCDLFTVYGFDTTLNFLNRMKSGEVPMGIADFNMYMTLTVAAPELAGRWAIAEIPGTRRADGTIDRTTGGNSAECGIIMEQSDKKDAAWQFLKWWTSAESQSAYAADIEAKQGIAARWPSANIEAFGSLSWTKEERTVIEKSFSNMREVPVVVGSYFTSRHIGNAWNSTVVNGVELRTALEKGVKDINKELKRKQEQYKLR